MRIPQSDPHAGYHAYRDQLDAAWRRVMDNGTYIHGPEAAAFEDEFAEYLQIGHAVGCGNGTDALRIALQAAGVEPGDRVLTVSHTAVATVSAIVQAGAEPVFVEIDPQSFLMDPSRLDETLRRRRDESTARLSAVVVVHLYGQPANLPAILDIANRHDLRVVEDCAQAHGVSLGDRKVGVWGAAAAFSFYPTKNLGGFGDGGMIVTDSDRLAERACRLREYGWNGARLAFEPGINSRLDELQAALLRVKLAHLDADNANRCAIASVYDQLLDESIVDKPRKRTDAPHVYHQYVVRCRQRDRLRQWLGERGIGSQIHYPVPVHRHPAFARYADPRTSLDETDRASREVLSLPIFPQLATRDAERVVEAIGRWPGAIDAPHRRAIAG